MPELEAGLDEGSLDELSAVLLGRIEAIEAERARLDARLLAAYGALHAVQRQQVEALPGPVEGASARERDGWCRQAVVAEIAEATGVPVGQVASRLSVAAEPGRYQPLLARLREGQISLAHALQVAADTDQLDPGLLEQVTARVFAPLRDGSRPSHATVTRRLRRAVISAAGADAPARRRRARARRSAYGRLTEDGMGTVTVVTTAERTVAILERVDRLARAMRAAGDGRSLDQLRSDLASDALLQHRFGPCPAHTPTAEPTTDAPSDPAGPTSDPAGPATAADGLDLGLRPLVVQRRRVPAASTRMRVWFMPGVTVMSRPR